MSDWTIHYTTGGNDCPTTYVETTTCSPPFEEYKHLLSDKPIRRATPKRRRFTNEELLRLAEESPPPQSWFDEDMEKPF